MRKVNEWLDEKVTNEHGTYSRRVAFEPNQIPHPVKVAEHVWEEAVKECQQDVMLILGKSGVDLHNVKSWDQLMKLVEECIK